MQLASQRHHHHHHHHHHRLLIIDMSSLLRCVFSSLSSQNCNISFACFMHFVLTCVVVNLTLLLLETGAQCTLFVTHYGRSPLPTILVHTSPRPAVSIRRLPTRHGRSSPHLRSADVHTCTVPRTQSRLGDRSFGVAGPRLWNSLPAELRQQDICLTEFRRLLKTVLFC